MNITNFTFKELVKTLVKTLVKIDGSLQRKVNVRNSQMNN